MSTEARAVGNNNIIGLSSDAAYSSMLAPLTTLRAMAIIQRYCSDFGVTMLGVTMMPLMCGIISDT